MPTGPIDLMFCLIGLVIIAGGVAIPILLRREDLEPSRRAIVALKYGGLAALTAALGFALVYVIVRVL